MKALLIFAAIMLALATDCLSQAPSVKEGIPFQAGLSGQWREVLYNQSSSSLVAFRVSFHCPRGGPGVEHDSLYHFSHDQNIAPGGSIAIYASDPAFCTGGVDVAIFSDGHAEGALEAIEQMFAQRQGAYNALDDSIKLLDAIPSGEESIQHVIDVLEVRAKARRTEMTAKGIGDASVCSLIVRILGDPRRDLRIPEDKIKAPLPEVADVAAQQNVSHDEARAIVLSAKLQMWRSALAGHLGPAAPK